MLRRASISSALPAGGVGSLPRKRGEARTEERGTVVGMESEVLTSGLEAAQNCAIGPAQRKKNVESRERPRIRYEYRV